jgi:hypothetical protein
MAEMSLAGLGKWLRDATTSDDRLWRELYAAATPEQRVTLDGMQAQKWGAQMDQQMPLAARNWREKNVPMPLYGYGSGAAPVEIPTRDPLTLPALRETPFGDANYPIGNVEVPGYGRYTYDEKIK